MRFFRHAGAAALALALATPAMAQSGGRGASFGVLAGATFSKIAGPAVEDADLKNRTSFAAGAFLQLGVSRNFAIEPQLLFIRKGAKGSATGGVDFGARLSYLEVPVLLTLNFPSASPGGVSPFLQAGPAIAFKLQCRLAATNGTTTISTNCEDVDPDPVKIKNTDVGVLFGAGVDVNRARIMARYELGLSKIVDATTDNDAKNRSIVLLVGWTFRSPN